MCVYRDLYAFTDVKYTKKFSILWYCILFGNLCHSFPISYCEVKLFCFFTAL